MSILIEILATSQTPATINQYVNLAVLPDATDYVGEGQECAACGWGYIDYVGCKYSEDVGCDVYQSRDDFLTFLS